MGNLQKVLTKEVNRKIGRAMHDYDMLADGDRVLVAVSGGVDSLVLAAVLAYWRSKAPIDYDLEIYHVEHGFYDLSPGAAATGHAVKEQLQIIELPITIVREWELKGTRTCFQCARNRRSQLFELARELGCNKIAFGHHKDDLVETLLLNIIYGGNISTMVPKQKLFNGNLHLIRPLAYVEKHEIVDIAQGLEVSPVKNPCPLADTTRRDHVREMLAKLYKEDPDIKHRIFASLGNVRLDYLL